MARKRSKGAEGDATQWRRPRSDSAARFLSEWEAEKKLLVAAAREFGKLPKDDFRRELAEIGMRKLLNSRAWTAGRLGLTLPIPEAAREFCGFKK